MELRAENVSMRYFRRRGEANFFEAVCPVTLSLSGGEMVVLKGKSGSGKTTLTHILAGLLNPSEGKVYLDGTDIYALDDAALSELRNKRIGVVPQGRSAVDTLTVYENILLPGMLYGKGEDESAKAEKWMEALGISDLRNAMPAELSGGELRRLAIARVLAKNLRAYLILAWLIGLSTGILGLIISYYLDAAAGASIACFQAAVLFLALLFKAIYLHWRRPLHTL